MFYTNNLSILHLKHGRLWHKILSEYTNIRRFGRLSYNFVLLNNISARGIARLWHKLLPHYISTRLIGCLWYKVLLLLLLILLQLQISTTITTTNTTTITNTTATTTTTTTCTSTTLHQRTSPWTPLAQVNKEFIANVGSDACTYCNNNTLLCI